MRRVIEKSSVQTRLKMWVSNEILYMKRFAFRTGLIREKRRNILKLFTQDWAIPY